MSAILLSQGLLLTMCEQDDPQNTPLREGWVAILDNRIALVTYDAQAAESFLTSHPEVEQIDCRDKVIMPGLINTHTHIPMTLLRNYADDMELMTWLADYIWKFEAHLTPDDFRIGARLGVAELLLGGCTTFVDMYFLEWAIAEVVEAMGARALLAETVLDGREQSFVENVDQMMRSKQSLSSRVEFAIAPHAPYTCSPATLSIAKECATKYSLPMTIHLSETAFEQTMIEERYGCSPFDYLMREGCADQSTIFAHSIYLNASQIESLANIGASVAHNAQSNCKLASGIAPVCDMLSRGVNVTIATDGASSNNDLDMWDEMRTATLLQRVDQLSATAMPAYEALRMATVNGAKAIGKQDELGLIKEGFLADIITVDLKAPHMRPRNNVISALVYSAKSTDVADVVVDGRLLVRDKTLLGVDLERLCLDAEASVARIKETLQNA